MVQLDKRQAERDNAGETHQLESTNSFSGLEPFANLPGAPSDRPPETLKGCATKTASAPGKAGYGNGAIPRDAGGKAFHDLPYLGERRHGGVAWGGHGQGAVGGDGGSVNHPVPRIEFQSTPPARAATCADLARLTCSAVSIHAARAGGDQGIRCLRPGSIRFNPRRPRGRRRGCR